MIKRKKKKQKKISKTSKKGEEKFLVAGNLSGGSGTLRDCVVGEIHIRQSRIVSDPSAIQTMRALRVDLGGKREVSRRLLLSSKPTIANWR